jgi:hypothetical protein
MKLTSGLSANRLRNLIRLSTRLSGITRVMLPTSFMRVKFFLKKKKVYLQKKNIHINQFLLLVICKASHPTELRNKKDRLIITSIGVTTSGATKDTNKGCEGCLISLL